MATIEKRIQALEQEHAELKKTIELQTVAIGALVNKAALEKLNEKYDTIFKTLENHDKFTNMQLAELREKVEVDIEGKIVGMQTEMRQRFTEQDGKLTGLQTEMRQRFTEQDGKLTGLQTEMHQRFAEQDGKLTGLQTEMHQRFAEQDGKLTGLQTEMHRRFTRIETVLAQLLARLPEKPQQ
ncbi:MAG TPA: hypothetical protein VHD63_05385 [Ktedonobacteraceae bacterium]|nr:hypothetical protein [Ktedonobacteraceae bacterium]